MSAASTTEKGELSSHISIWTKDKASADLLGLQWAALQGKYYKIENNIKYVTKGSIIACDNGTLFSRIDLPIDHGVEVKSNHLPIMTTEDFGSQNIPLFGICKKRTTSAVTYHCSPAINNQWIQNANTTAANKAALLQADAFAVCAFGGIICVKEVNKTPQESMMVIYRDQYGFDEKTTKIILDLYNAIQVFYPDENQLVRDWRFTRLLGGFCYALPEVDPWYEVAAFNQTAGNAIPYNMNRYKSTTISSGGREVVVVDATPMPPLEAFMTNHLGLSNEDYQYLQYKVRIQNFLVSKNINTVKYDDVEEINSNYQKKMSIGLGRTLGNKEFFDLWNKQCDDMFGLIDFAHQHIIIAAILVTEASKFGSILDLVMGDARTRERKAGWLGDTTISEDPDVKPSMGNDDYMADLDAENIAYMVRSKNYSFINAIEDYYEGQSKDNDNRALIFLENNSISEIKRLIYNELLLVEYNDKLSRMAWGDFKGKSELIELYDYESENWLNLLKDDKSPAAYNFIRSLEENPPLPEMRDYIEKK